MSLDRIRPVFRLQVPYEAITIVHFEHGSIRDAIEKVGVDVRPASVQSPLLLCRLPINRDGRTSDSPTRLSLLITDPKSSC